MSSCVIPGLSEYAYVGTGDDYAHMLEGMGCSPDEVP